MLTILLTGANGRIGRAFFESYAHRYRFVLADRTIPAYAFGANHRWATVDLSHRESVVSLVSNVDVVLHLAAVARPDANFEELLPNNILATTYVLEAASRACCRRVVFASSAQTIEGYAVDRQIDSTMGVSPANLYGVSKCYGEALCSYYATQAGLSCIAIRIGAFEYPDNHHLENARDLSAWLSPRDACHLLQRAVEAESIDFLIAYGISNNRFKRFDLTETRRVLGYAPQDDAFETFQIPLDRLFVSNLPDAPRPKGTD